MVIHVVVRLFQFVRYTGKPIKFTGTGEKITDIETFHPDRMSSRILGMGDLLTLIEKASQEYDEKKSLELAEKMRENTFDFNDFIDQLDQVQNMGPYGGFTKDVARVWLTIQPWLMLK